MKDEKLLDELKARLDIVDIISDYVELKRAGQNYKGLCPFHAEKTPSFMVSPDKHRFHCFGCGVGGDIISFVVKYENLSFQDSLKLLAKKAGLDLKEYRFSSSNEGLREKLIEIHREASKAFAENLKRSKGASSYLKGRGLTEDSVHLFSLGYATKDWHHLSHYLNEKGFPMSVILQSGIVSSGEKGIYDTFRDRIMFPICDVQGDIIAFGGRVMDDSQPKYLNSPDTPLFKKGETLYGLNRAKEGIRKRGCAIIVEGYLDVMMSHQCGFDNTVAPLGTALTPGHLRKLKRFTKKAVLVFDGDEAGKAAARRSVPILLEEGFASKILLLSEKDDPDSFLRKNGNVPYGKLLGEAKSVIDFILSVSRKDKTETVHEAIEIILSASDAIMKEELVGELAQRTGKSEIVIREEMKKKGKRPGERAKIPCSPHRAGLCYDEELLLLSAVIAFPEQLAHILHALKAEQFRNMTVRGIFEKLGRHEGKGSVDPMMAALEDDERSLIDKVTFDPGFDHETVDRNVKDCIRIIRERGSGERQRQIHEKIRQAEKKGDQELLHALLQERQRLIKEAR